MGRKIRYPVVPVVFLICCGGVLWGSWRCETMDDRGWDDRGSKVPIVFSKHYDITLFGIQKLHPFDSEKYGRVYRYLIKHSGLDRESFYTPQQVSQENLLSVHTKEYLASLKKSWNIALIAELGTLAVVPGFLLQKRLLRPMKYGTGGTILACRLALDHGWAVNLAGGYHHAKADSGGGFCFFADIPIAVCRAWERSPDMPVLIVDLDAHQGNGCELIFGNDSRIHIFDIYNRDVFPQDTEARRYIEFDFPVRSFIKDAEYLPLLEDELLKAISKSKPGLIIYNAGTDIFEDDPLGAMCISEDGIIRRDEIVFKAALTNKVPIVMLLAGGYTSGSAEIIGRSLDNLLKNVIPAENQEKQIQITMQSELINDSI